MPKRIDGSLGLASPDSIEIARGVEERLGLGFDEREDLVPHFESLGTLTRFITVRLGAE